MNKTVRIIFFVVASVCIAILFWCHRVFCRRNDKKLTTTPRLQIKKRWNGKRSRPASASPLRDVSSNHDRSSSYLPLLSPDLSNQPPLGFKNAANMPQVGKSKVVAFRNATDAYPSTSQAAYPSKRINNTYSTPYPLCNIMPQPSTSKTSSSSGRLRSETPEFIQNICYPPPHNAANSSSKKSRIPYSPEINTINNAKRSNITASQEGPYVISNSELLQHSSLRPYSSEHTSCEMQDFTKSMPYDTHIYEVPYQESNWTTFPTPATERFVTSSATYGRTATSYPANLNTPLPVRQTGIVLRPPSYEEALRHNFDLK